MILKRTGLMFRCLHYRDFPVLACEHGCHDEIEYDQPQGYFGHGVYVLELYANGAGEGTTPYVGPDYPDSFIDRQGELPFGEEFS